MTLQIEAEMGVRDIPGVWSVARIKSREERAVCRRLEDAGIATYLPLVSRLRIYHKRRVEAQEAVFPGYLFAAFQDDWQRGTALNTDGVFELLRVVNQGRFVNEIAAIETALELNPDLGVDQWVKGDRCRVKAGHPMEGVQGLVSEQRSQTLLLLSVEILGQAGVTMEIDPAFVERI